MKESILDIPAWLTVTVLHEDDATDDQIKRLAMEASNAATEYDANDYTIDVTPALDFVLSARVYPRQFSPLEYDAGAIFDLFEIVETDDAGDTGLFCGVIPDDMTDERMARVQPALDAICGPEDAEG